RCPRRPSRSSPTGCSKRCGPRASTSSRSTRAAGRPARTAWASRTWWSPVRDIDVRHLGVPLVICCHVIDDVIVDPGPESTMGTLLAELGDWQPAKILLTHIHLDHAGAAGALAQRWPDAEVWVHERGARHTLDPSRLMASAARIYGDDMDRLWGDMHPVPEDRLRVLSGGETIGAWRGADTPRPAAHHVSYPHEPRATATM